MVDPVLAKIKPKTKRNDTMGNVSLREAKVLGDPLRVMDLRARSRLC